MKKLLLVTSLVFSAVSATSLFAQDADDAPRPLVSFIANAVTKIGMTRAQVLTELGAPSEKLANDLWVYWDFRPISRPAGERNDALLVVFVNDKINRLRLTERSLVEAAIAKVKAAAAAKSPIIARN
jgi:hypothetical protein